MVSENKVNELKRAVATFIIRTPFADEKEWYELYNEFVHSDKKYVDERFGAVSNMEFEELSSIVIKMIKDAQYKRYKVI